MTYRENGETFIKFDEVIDKLRQPEPLSVDSASSLDLDFNGEIVTISGKFAEFLLGVRSRGDIITIFAELELQAEKAKRAIVNSGLLDTTQIKCSSSKFLLPNTLLAIIHPNRLSRCSTVYENKNKED